MPNARVLKVLSLATFPMLLFLALKLLCIWFFTSRAYLDAHGAILGDPYDLLVFNTFDRFTDWMMPAAQAKLLNPYDLTVLHALNTPASPYGYLSFALMKIGNVLGLYPLFLMSVAAYLYLNFLILRTRLAGPLLLSLNTFAALLIACYPLYFEIDRGNIVIWEAVALSAIFLGFIRTMNGWSYACILAVTACFKPAFLLFIIPVLAVEGFPQMLAALAIVGVNYAIPVFLPGGGPYYLIHAIKNAASVSISSSFCHNIACGLRAIGVSPATSVIAVLFSLPLLYIAYHIRRSENPWRHAPLLVVLTTLTSLLIADPSSDYALTLLLPIFLYMLPHEMLDCERTPLWRSGATYLIIGFVLAMSFINMPFPNFPDFTSPLRCLGVLTWYAATIRYMFVALGTELTHARPLESAAA